MNKLFKIWGADKLLLCVALSALLSVSNAKLSSTDLSSMGVSARPLGMGGMFVSVAGDPASLIHNPAGVAGVEKMKFYLMGAQTLQEVNYFNGGVVIPVNIGVVGISLLNRNVGRIPITEELVVFPDGSVDYSNIKYASYDESAAVFTYANRWDMFARKFNYGINLKFFQRRTGNYKSGNASGMNLDMGSIVDLTPDYTLGLKLQNLLQAGDAKGAAGTLSWDTGETESIDSYFICGITNKTFQRNVLIGMDVKKNLTRSMYPATLHLGVEWHPINEFFLRAGMGQYHVAPDISDEGQIKAVNGYTAGLGLNLYGWRFDYAYHPDSDIKELSAHLFSISFVGDEPIEKAVEKSAVDEIASTVSAITIIAPEDKTVTTSSFVEVIGSVLNTDRYLLNGEEYLVSGNGQFNRDVDLALGINDIILGIPNNENKVGIKVLRLADFKDIDGSPYKTSIINMATLGYISGDYPDRFNPNRIVSRAEMASAVVKIQRMKQASSLRGVLDDVDILSGQGVLRGFPDGLMRPEEKLTNGQLAMVLARLQDLPISAKQSEYSYLSQEHWSEEAVQALTATGLYIDQDFSPRGGFVTKEKMSEMLSRMPLVQNRLTKLFNFEETTFEDAAKPPVFMKKPGVSSDTSTDMEMFNKMMEEDLQKSGKAVDMQSLLYEKNKGKLSTANAGAANLVVYAPADRSTVYTESLAVKGAAGGAAKVLVNGNTSEITNGNFSAVVVLKEGKNLITVKAFWKDGKSAVVKRNITKLKKIGDVGAANPLNKTIAAMVSLGYFNTTAGGFNPSAKVTKAEYAKILAKVYGLTPADPVFKELKTEDPMTRAFAVVMLTRLEKIQAVVPDKDPYQDVNSKYWAYKHIAAAKKAGLIQSANYFRPAQALDRQTAALFISNTKKAKADLQKLN